MCKHILNAQVQIRAQCCKKWFDCGECHAESEDHEIMKNPEMIMACKKCKKVFRKDMSQFEESDEYCPRCDNHFYIDAVTPEDKGKLVIEFEAKKGHENKMFKDEREKDR
mmetsp:Transcript_44700/g.32743  ORF Transcript_44700/g.32743 Transcript_44700/m.32743 type:complete len:110 (-) Transcript_44700:79-408(-)